MTQTCNAGVKIVNIRYIVVNHAMAPCRLPSHLLVAVFTPRNRRSAGASKILTVEPVPVSSISQQGASAMKQILRRTVRWLLPRLVDELDLLPAMTRYGDDAVAQKTLAAQYRLLAAHGKQCLPGIANVGFRKYSQFEEDGILLYIFSLIEPINRKCVEICAGEGRECNTANLIINHGWWGYLFDGD